MLIIIISDFIINELKGIRQIISTYNMPSTRSTEPFINSDMDPNDNDPNKSEYTNRGSRYGYS